MLTFWGDQSRRCDGVSRRDFLKVGAFGAGLSLAEMLRLRAVASPTARPKSAIMIYLGGGPSHMDMYDLKPDAPAEFRGEFKPIQTNIPGVQISEHFPLQARMWDKMACVRSIVSVNEHSDVNVMTGYPDRVNRTAHHPSFGSVISKLRGYGAGVPPFVSLRGASRGCEPGFLGISHRPFTSSGPALSNLSINRSLEANLGDRRQLLKDFDTIRRDIDTQIEGMDAFTTRAFDLVSSGKVRDALDIKQEEPRSRERYKGCENFLKARRLIEAGAGCVTLSIGGWDTHQGNFTKLKKQLPQVDRALANLTQDLVDRGLHQDVITVMWGEFGRTPRVNKKAGRDHWPSVMSAFVSGGGLKMGQAVGESNARGERPKDVACTPSNLLATFYKAMGIDPAMTLPDNSGRPIYLLDDRKLVNELL